MFNASFTGAQNPRLPEGSDLCRAPDGGHSVAHSRRRAGQPGSGANPSLQAVRVARDANGEAYRTSSQARSLGLSPVSRGWELRAEAGATLEYPSTEIALVLDNSASAHGPAQEVFRRA